MNGSIQSAGADAPNDRSGLMDLFMRLAPRPTLYDPRAADPRATQAVPPWDTAMRTDNYPANLEDSDIAPTGGTGGESKQVMPALGYLLKMLFGTSDLPILLGNRAIGANTNELRNV